MAIFSLGGGVSQFTKLTDTPNSYSGQAGKVARVKSTEDALEFVDVNPTNFPSIPDNFTDLGDTPSDYTGQGGKIIQVKSTEDGLEFADKPTAGFNSRVRVYLSSDQTIPATTEDVIQFDTEVFDTLNEYDTSNHRFVPSENGYYLITVIVTLSSNAGSNDRISFRVNGSRNIDFWLNGVQSYRGISFSAIVYLTTSDYLDVTYMNPDSPTTKTILGDSKTTVLMIHRLS